MVLSFGTPSTHESALKKLASLREYFEKLFRDKPETKVNADGSSLAQGIFLAEALFSRAPLDWVSRADTEHLAEIALDASRFYQQFLVSKQAFSVEIHPLKRKNSKKASSIILTALEDRPFIVDTLTEFLRTNGIRHHVLLHPILKSNDGRLTSLTYFEVDAIDDAETVHRFKQDLETRFADLLLITEDFKPIIQKIETLVSDLRNENSQAADLNKLELRDYLRWLADGGFVFLGANEFHCKNGSLVPVEHAALGILRSRNEHSQQQAKNITSYVAEIAPTLHQTHFQKVTWESPIHRYVRMELITVKLEEKHDSSRIHCFLGLLTSKAMSQEAASVPLIRRKLRSILELEGLLPNSHDYKEIISIADSFPKGELLQYPVETLRQDINTVISIQGRSELRVRYFLDSLKLFVSILVVLPRERFSSEVRKKILAYLEQRFSSTHASSEYHTTSSDYPLSILHVLLPNNENLVSSIPVEDLEREISELIHTWDDMLSNQLQVDSTVAQANKLLSHYSAAFPDSYKTTVSPEEALVDIRVLEGLTSEHNLELAIEKRRKKGKEELYDLKIYKQGDSLTLSAILPFLENAGFNIVEETVTPIDNRSGLHTAIYKLGVKTRSGQPIEMTRAKEALLPGLELVIAGKADNDRLNELMLSPGLACRQVAILRVITNYLWQIKASTSSQAIIAALVENPNPAEKLVEYFATKFDPAQFTNDLQSRVTRLEQIHEEFQVSLKSVVQLAHDRSLRRLLNVIESTVRTNYYRVPDETRIALKIDCKKIERMPTPRPCFEIFVNAHDFEGVHLRGGKVARGGIRWSDRTDDYRTEVLGLMKTQMVKNAIIIPVGAKGGFVLKNRPTQHAELLAAVKTCYTRFIRSLLEVTDNRIHGKIVHPPQCVVYDGEDPYFVVAADRGTATFSDTANALAVSEFQLWIGDAFASGGSNGYDHKKLAITSRGVWETVCRHFREIGIDPHQQEFTAVGIGDMSGDVFGNGLLRSDKTKLVAAFDHRHIFLDPTPDTAASFQERKRLFDLPTSSWKDYNEKLISAGGGVFDRSQKEIPLSAACQQVLGVQASALSGQELIRAILRAPVDLLWNGGIGTYVKSAEEDDLAVGDRANDDVRVDARELRVKIVGEGGNLGFTQRARIEYSKIGGHINTDALDNSGGVNMSDLEVNLKILLSSPVERGELSATERNSLLAAIADDVSEKVIARNRAQSLALSLGVRRSRKNIGYIRGFLSALEQEGLLDRKSEFLPDDETLVHRSQLKAGLTRPELAVILGYAKMSLFNVILDSALPEEPFYQHYLLEYFPKVIQDRFRKDILEHPLRREIIATELANACVNRMGATFVFRSADESGVDRTSVLRAFAVADAIVRGDELTQKLEIIDRPNSTRQHLIVLIRLTSAIDSMSRWLLDHPHEGLSVADSVARYAPSFQQLAQATDSLTTQTERNRFRESCKQLIVAGVSRELAISVSSLIYSTVYLDIIEVANLANAPVLEVAKLFAQLYLELHIRPLIEHSAEYEPVDRFEASAIRTLMADVRRSIAKIALIVIQQKGSPSIDGMVGYLGNRKEIITRYQENYREFSGKPLSVPALLLLTNQLFALSRV